MEIRDSPESAIRILNTLHEINNPYSLLVSLFHVCNTNYRDIENLIKNRTNQTYKNFADSLKNKFANCFDEDEFASGKISLEPLSPETLANPNLAKIYIATLLSSLDMGLYGLISEDDNYSSFFEEAANNPNYYSEYTCIFDKEKYFLVPAPCQLLTSSESQDWILDPHNRLLFFHTVFPKRIEGVEVEAFPLSKEGRSIYQDLSKSKKIKIACPAPDKKFEFESSSQLFIDSKTSKFVFKKIKDESLESAWEMLLNTLESCKKNNVDIIVFPELTIDSELLNRIQNWLGKENFNSPKEDELPDPPIKMVVAGSFHFEETSKGFFNRCVVLDYAGSLLWKHEKLTPFSFSPNFEDDTHTSTKLAKALMSNEDIEKAKNQNEFKIKEDILHGGKITFCDAIWGRMATPICRDYIDDYFIQACKKVRANFFAVPMMSYGFSYFLNTAKNKYAREVTALTFFCPSEWILNWSEIEPIPELKTSGLKENPIIPKTQEPEQYPIQNHEKINCRDFDYDIWEISLENSKEPGPNTENDILLH